MMDTGRRRTAGQSENDLSPQKIDWYERESMKGVLLDVFFHCREKSYSVCRTLFLSVINISATASIHLFMNICFTSNEA